MSDAMLDLLRDHSHPPEEASIAAVIAAFLDHDHNLTADDRQKGALIAERFGVKPGLSGEAPALVMARYFKDWRVMRRTMARAEAWAEEVNCGTESD